MLLKQNFKKFYKYFYQNIYTSNLKIIVTLELKSGKLVGAGDRNVFEAENCWKRRGVSHRGAVGHSLILADY